MGPASQSEKGGLGSWAARWAERKVEGGARRARWAVAWFPERLFFNFFSVFFFLFLLCFFKSLFEKRF